MNLASVVPLPPEPELGSVPIEHDYYIFAGLAIFLGLVLGYWMWKRLHLKRAWWVLLVVISGVLVSAWVAAARAGTAERDRYAQMLSSLTATYAGESQHLGHEAINLQTQPDDPLYLELIEAQKRWLTANPQINDIYTFRLSAEGDQTLIVDSETDYNRDGKIEGAKESRTPIGEVWEEWEPALQSALHGTPAFSARETKDRWGSWYSFFTPLYRRNGTLDGALGIDLNSKGVIHEVSRARMAALHSFGVLYLAFVVVMGSVGAAVLARRSTRERELAEETAQERLKLKELVLAVEGVVWESSLNAVECAYVSPQVEAMIGWPQAQWKQDKDFWRRRLHSEDREWALRQRCQALEGEGGFQIEYRMLHRDGSVVWVRERGSVHLGTLGNVLRGVMTDVTNAKQQAIELERSSQQLMEASHQAGMAEVATGVLHNVGNVLNSVNISSSLIGEAVRQSSLPTLQQVAAVLLEQDDLSKFMQSPRGQAIPPFLRDLHLRMVREQEGLNNELHTLTSSVEHIKEIVIMQQSYARMGGRSEPLDLTDLLEDALHINSAALHRHRIEVIKDYQPVPRVQVERNKVLQILVNLIRNAKHAIEDFNPSERLLRLSIAQGADGFVNVFVSDNGMGVHPDNLTRLFSYGFTTRKTGHGFGLHSSVNTAREMGGALTASSAGSGQGATFCLSLPATDPLPSSPANPVTSLAVLGSASLQSV